MLKSMKTDTILHLNLTFLEIWWLLESKSSKDWWNLPVQISANAAETPCWSEICSLKPVWDDLSSVMGLVVLLEAAIRRTSLWSKLSSDASTASSTPAAYVFLSAWTVLFWPLTPPGIFSFSFRDGCAGWCLEASGCCHVIGWDVRSSWAGVPGEAVGGCRRVIIRLRRLSCRWKPNPVGLQVALAEVWTSVFPVSGHWCSCWFLRSADGFRNTSHTANLQWRGCQSSPPLI